MNQIWNGKWEMSPSLLQTKDYNIVEHIHKCLTEKTQSIMSSCGSYATPNSGSSRWTPLTLNYDELWGENCRCILFGNNHMGTPSCWVIELCLHLLWNAAGHIIKIYARPYRSEDLSLHQNFRFRPTPLAQSRYTVSFIVAVVLL